MQIKVTYDTQAMMSYVYLPGHKGKVKNSVAIPSERAVYDYDETGLLVGIEYDYIIDGVSIDNITEVADD